MELGKVGRLGRLWKREVEKEGGGKGGKLRREEGRGGRREGGREAREEDF